MPKKSIDKNLIFLLVCTLITLASWIGYEVYQAYATAKVEDVPPSYLIKLDPTLDTKVLEKIEKRIL